MFFTGRNIPNIYWKILIVKFCHLLSAALNASSRNFSGPFTIAFTFSSLFKSFTSYWANLVKSHFFCSLKWCLSPAAVFKLFQTWWYQWSRVSLSGHSRSKLFACKKFYPNLQICLTWSSMMEKHTDGSNGHAVRSFTFIVQNKNKPKMFSHFSKLWHGNW